MPYSWEGNRRSGVALATRHRLQWFRPIQLRAHGLRKGDGRPAYTRSSWGMALVYLLMLLQGQFGARHQLVQTRAQIDALSSALARRRAERDANDVALSAVGDVKIQACLDISAHTHTHTRLTDLCPRLPGRAGTRQVKPIWILLRQEKVSGSGIVWAVCKSAPRSRQTTMPAPHHSSFYRPDALPAAQPTASKH